MVRCGPQVVPQQRAVAVLPRHLAGRELPAQAGVRSHNVIKQKVLVGTVARVCCARMRPVQRYGVVRQSQQHFRQSRDILSTVRPVQDVRRAHTVRAVRQHHAAHVQQGRSIVAPMHRRARMSVPDIMPPGVTPVGIIVRDNRSVPGRHTVPAV